MKRVRRRRHPRPLSTFTTYLFVAGGWPSRRLAGWPDYFSLSSDDMRSLVDEHREALEAEAAAHGFRPHCLVPDVDDVEAARRAAWATEFVLRYGY